MSELIRKAILNIVDSRLKNMAPASTWATVKSVSGQTCIVTIEVSDTETLDIEDVQLGQVNSGFVVYPQQNSKVIINSLDNLYTNWFIGYTEKIDRIEIAGNANGGIPITANVVARLNNVETIVNSLIGIYNLHTHLVSGSVTAVPSTEETNTLTETVDSDIESTKVTHGNG